LLAPLELHLHQADHLLAALQGLLPADAAEPEIDIGSLVLPTDLPLTLPSELVRQRPDILAAEAQLHVASAAVGVATAALYPSFVLSATYGGAGSSLGDLGAAANRFWSFGPSLLAPLFHGGTLQAARQGALAAYDQAQANYRQVVLAAFEQVADSLKALEADALALEAQSQSRRDAAQAVQLLQAGEKAGMVAAIDVMGADVQLQGAEIAYVQALALRQQDTVALFVALGGGWWDGAGETP
jgi:NodT family efflux transporter outer membrane factor (OMF) lipoprotein